MMMTRRIMKAVTIIVALLVPALAGAQQVTKENVEGIRNFARLDTTIACAGATAPTAVPELKKMGYASIIDLREATENGANIDEEAAAAKAAGINFVHLPFNGSKPDPAIIEGFEKAVTTPANQPAFVHCASGNRASALWLIKRIDVDGWDEDRAVAEATSLGLTSPALKDFALNYAKEHKK
jgi:uncharacterized protein (TIGR01244 family)